jgi:hypothetical protein
VIGAGIENWAAISENNERRLNLRGPAELIAAEMAWMAYWQAADGTRSSILALNQLANILRRATALGRAFPDSIRAMDWEYASALQNWFYLHRWGRMGPQVARPRLRIVFRFAGLALSTDPAERTGTAGHGCPPGQIATPWLRSECVPHGRSQCFNESRH